MSILESLFGSAADNEKKISDLWKNLKGMPKAQLLDIIKLRMNSPHGKLALILLFKMSRSDAEAIVKKSDDGWHAGLLANMMRSDVILLGKGEQFDEIRRFLKDALRIVDPGGDW